MNEKNESFINNNLYSFKTAKSFRKSFVERESQKLNEEIDFRRTTSACILNTDGEKPLILYLKSIKQNNYLFENKKFESLFEVNNYLSDGGLNQKRKKFLNLLSNYPINYKFNTPIKQKKKILNDLKNKKFKYHSLSYSNKKYSKNKNKSNNDVSQLVYNSNIKKVNINFLNNNENRS